MLVVNGRRHFVEEIALETQTETQIALPNPVGIPEGGAQQSLGGASMRGRSCLQDQPDPATAASFASWGTANCNTSATERSLPDSSRALTIREAT